MWGLLMGVEAGSAGFRRSSQEGRWIYGEVELIREGDHTSPRGGNSSALEGAGKAVAAPARPALATRMALRFPLRLDSPRTVPAQSPHSPRTVPDGNLHSPRCLLIFKGN